MLNSIVQQDPPAIKSEHSLFLKNLVLELLNKDADKRINIKTLLEKGEIAEEIKKIKRKTFYEEFPAKLSFQDYLKKIENEENNMILRKNSKDQLENDLALTKKSQKNCFEQEIENIDQKNNHLKPPRQHFRDILNNISNNTPKTTDTEGLKTRSHSMNNNNISNISNENNQQKQMNIHMETIIKLKASKANQKEETINNFSSYLKNENNTFLNNQTQIIQNNNAKALQKHIRRCSINTRPPENLSNNCVFPKNFCFGPENQESLKKNSIEFLKKIFDSNAPIAAKRKHLLKEFLHKKLGKKICDDVQVFIEKQGEYLGRENLYSAILGLIGKENENYILIFNYLFNPDSLYLIKKSKN